MKGLLLTLAGTDKRAEPLAHDGAAETDRKYTNCREKVTDEVVGRRGCSQEGGDPPPSHSLVFI